MKKILIILMTICLLSSCNGKSTKVSNVDSTIVDTVDYDYEHITEDGVVYDTSHFDTTHALLNK